MSRTRGFTTKYIFVSGGVLSGLGKGLCAASLGFLLKRRGYSVSSLKCENYLNIDSGTINPIEHGDPFLCDDGLEADMDLGTYERILNQNMGFSNFVTKGQIFKTIIDRERSMYYGGETVEDIPHVTQEIVSKIKKAGKGSDFCIVEIGGTVGEYQNVLYYEAARFLKVKYPGTVVDVHVSYLPIPRHLGEPKTKPTQMSVRTLMSMGINPEFLVLRSEYDLDQRRRSLLGTKSGVPGNNVIMAKDLHNIYELPVNFANQDFDKKILKHFNLPINRLNISDWKDLIKKVDLHRKRTNVKKQITIVIAGKYLSKNEGDFELTDAYHALIEAIKHASWHSNIYVKIKMVNTTKLNKDYLLQFKDVDGIIVPIGWGKRGVTGKIKAIKYAREHKIPYLGLCYGMQLATIEFARNVVKIKGADTEETNPNAKNKIIHSIPFDKKYQVIKGTGTSMRLGAYDCVLKKNTLAHNIYAIHNEFKDKKRNLISERHRHRFEFNNEYRKALEEKGMVFSGTSPDDFFVEYIELKKELHPFFIATQAHPEYKSRPLKPHPVFIEFLKAAKSYYS
ncbi:CTP synthetase [candidate division WWE3 bacterium CG10_big_fil_rev_8_21_14_0_10_32_10]|uniref:CTP synthase (glutamine hydrolyzing) n=1 Tax=candidate division WWE3 bacterium CG10_big_fil_rev_8_21_14_0_10_32_10 TaxID=1975090 RepID=A0A2H0RDA0_UNCKA|nr:MAG: CTP synthetase [candidate division WWE3 bacterium CG10_big_fil_rev_8_21_14_0_10_32_10]